MKFFSDCSGECCVCACSGHCLAGHGDDDFVPAAKEKIIKKLDSGNYTHSEGYMIRFLEEYYSYKYSAKKKKKKKKK